MFARSQGARRILRANTVRPYGKDVALININFPFSIFHGALARKRPRCGEAEGKTEASDENMEKRITPISYKKSDGILWKTLWKLWKTPVKYGFFGFSSTPFSQNRQKTAENSVDNHSPSILPRLRATSPRPSSPPLCHFPSFFC